jgi:hypothetical protein
MDYIEGEVAGVLSEMKHRAHESRPAASSCERKQATMSALKLILMDLPVSVHNILNGSRE